MTVVWIVAVAALGAALARRLVWPYERESSLGFVSNQWLAERRVSDMADRQQ
jgi:hypothetical protein